MEEGRGVLDAVMVPAFMAAAHELKAPLSLIRQLSLELETGEYNEIERRVLARQITLTTERSLRLTTDLTKVYRLEDAMFELEPVNPSILCNEVVDGLKLVYQAHGRKLTLTSRAKRSLVVANRDLLRRIILNFSDNALQYGDSQTPIKISIRKNGPEKIRVGVRDFGPALPDGVFAAIKRGLRSPLAMHNRPGSSGLGIFIASEFASAMGANIGTQRHHDGVTFFIDIPISTQMKLL